jgi:hypothetical protein
MRAYIEEQADELNSAGVNIAELLSAVEETPVATRILRNFARVVEGRLANRANAGGGL